MLFKNQRIIGSFKYMICINLFHACNRTLDNSNGSPTLPTLKRVIESFSLWYELFVIAIFLNNKIQRLETFTITLLLGISYLFIPKESDVSFEKLLPLKVSYFFKNTLNFKTIQCSDIRHIFLKTQERQLTDFIETEMF